MSETVRLMGGPFDGETIDIPHIMPNIAFPALRPLRATSDLEELFDLSDLVDRFVYRLLKSGMRDEDGNLIYNFHEFPDWYERTGAGGDAK